MTVIRSVVLGCGAYLPEKVLTNAELAAKVDTSDDWIRRRTGVGSRFMADPGTGPSDLAAEALRAAIADAEAMLQVARTGQGPREQIPSMGCSIKWRDG